MATIEETACHVYPQPNAPEFPEDSYTMEIVFCMILVGVLKDRWPRLTSLLAAGWSVCPKTIYKESLLTNPFLGIVFPLPFLFNNLVFAFIPQPQPLDSLIWVNCRQMTKQHLCCFAIVNRRGIGRLHSDRHCVVICPSALTHLQSKLHENVLVISLRLSQDRWVNDGCGNGGRAFLPAFPGLPITRPTH